MHALVGVEILLRGLLPRLAAVRNGGLIDLIAQRAEFRFVVPLEHTVVERASVVVDDAEIALCLVVVHRIGHAAVIRHDVCSLVEPQIRGFIVRSKTGVLRVRMLVEAKIRVVVVREPENKLSVSIFRRVACTVMIGVERGNIPCAAYIIAADGLAVLNEIQPCGFALSGEVEIVLEG